MFKVAMLNSRGDPSAYCVFSGADRQKEQPTSPFFPSIFTSEELAFIAAEECPVVISSFQLYPDESVKSVKQKLIWTLLAHEAIHKETTNANTELDEICAELETDGTAAVYMFGRFDAPFSFLDFYREATRQDTIPLTRPMFTAFLENFRGTDPKNKDKDTDPVDAIYQLPEYVSVPTFQYENWADVDWFAPGTIKPRLTPIGLRFVHHNVAEKAAIYNNTDLFSVDPSAIKDDELGKVYTASPSEVLTSSNYEFLLSYGNIIGRTLYAYTADTVTTMWSKNNVTQISRLVNTYFPLLKRVFDQQPPPPPDMNQTTITTGTAHTKSVPTTMDENMETVMSFLSGVDLEKHPTVSMKQSAIQQLSVSIIPEKTGLKFPLESVFKNVHATMDIPFIQFNPGLKREKSYRVYHESIAQNGNAIPFVSEHVLLEFKKHAGKSANITFYLWLGRGNRETVTGQTTTSKPPILQFSASDFLHITLMENGTILMHSGDMTVPVPDVQFAAWFQEKLAPVVSQLNEFFGQSGFAIRENIAITDTKVRIASLKYVAVLSIAAFVNVTQVMALAAPIFYEDVSDVPPELVTRRSQDDNRLNLQDVNVFRRYKRVEGFKKPNPYHQFIASALVLTSDLATIRQQMKRQFPDQTDAQIRAHMQEFSEEQLTKNASGKTASRKLSNKSGFKTHFFKSKYNSQWTVTVSQISSVGYVPCIRQYLSALFVAMQDADAVPPVLKRLVAPGVIPSSTAAVPEAAVPGPKEPVPVVPVLETEYDAIDEKEAAAEMAANEGEEEEEGEDGDQPDLGFMYEEEEEEEEERSGDEGGTFGGTQVPYKGGASTKMSMEKYFLTRIMTRDERMGQHGYARSCQANAKRQPVIITETEKAEIDARYKGSAKKPYQHALQYGTSTTTNEKLYYICPKYWCTKPGEERPMSEEDVKAGTCGKVIQNPRDIKPGEYTYQVGTSERQEPGFVNKTKHPDGSNGICTPCCFKDWDNSTQKLLRPKCNPSEYPPPAGTAQGKKAPPAMHEHLPLLNTTPLHPGRFGFMPTAVHSFLRAGPRDQMVTNQNYPILGRPILVKYGVVQPGYAAQTFLGCIADVYVYQQSRKGATIPYPTIPEIRSILADAIDLDLFVRVNNASLAALFRPSTVVAASEWSDAYAHTELYKRINLSINSHRQFFDATVAAFLGFKAYLLRPDIVLDPTYLWEIVSQPNAKLLPDGLNLAILDVPGADITDNVNLLCPPNNYLLPSFDPAKETLILIKQDESGTVSAKDPTPRNIVYEPVYLYEIYEHNGLNHVRIRKTFRLDAPASSSGAANAAAEKDTVLSGVQAVIRLIGMLSNKTCGKSSATNPMTTNESATDVLAHLRKIPEIRVEHQISNFQNLCVGFAVKCTISEPASKYYRKTYTVYVPTAPSVLAGAGGAVARSVLAGDGLSPIMMDSPTLRNSFLVSVDLLRYISNKSGGKILCAPHTKVVDEDNHLVGILTVTNQFISVKPEGYIPNKDDGLNVLDGSNYMLRDIDLQTNEPNTDPSGTEVNGNETHRAYVRNIQLESQFYVAFRNTVRVMLNLYTNRVPRQQLRALVNDTQTPYRQKRAQMEQIVRAVVRGAVGFHEYGAITAREIYICTGKSAASKPYCAARTDGVPGHKLLLPSRNLTKPERSNNVLYFARISDELLRNRGVQTMLRPGNMQLTGSNEHVIFDDEILLTGNSLSDAYFRELVPFPPTVSTTTYGTARTGERIEPAVQWNETQPNTTSPPKTTNVPANPTTKKKVTVVAPKQTTQKKNKGNITPY